MGCGCGDCKFRPIGFLLGLPFAFLSLFISFVSIFVWIFGLTLSCICPCCFCFPLLTRCALKFIKAPISIMKAFISKIPY